MKIISILFGLVLIGVVSLHAEDKAILKLYEAYQMALVQSESVALQEETIRIAEAHYLQALGDVLPHMDVNATELIQDTGGGSAAGSSIGTTFTRRSRPEVAVNLTQHLFQGFREFRTLRVSGAEQERAQLQRDRARQLLFSDTARAYYTVLEVEQELQIRQAIQKMLHQRVSELQQRVQLGKSREGDLLATEAQLASVQAQVEKDKGLVSTARDYLGFLVGREVTERLLDEFEVPRQNPPVESYVAKLTGRPDIGASWASVTMAKGQLSYEKGGRYPTLDLSANYYPYRVGFQSDIDWDLNFSLKVPIFQGGATRGKIREARAELKQAELTRQLTTRQAELEVRQAYHTLASAESQEALFHKAEQKGEATYHSLRDEEQHGLVNSLDVLEALRQWQDQRLQANQSRFQTKLNYLQLLVATGDLSQVGTGGSGRAPARAHGLEHGWAEPETGPVPGEATEP